LGHFTNVICVYLYAAVSRLTDEGLVSVREELQEKRPDRKVYSITDKGRTRFLEALNRPIQEDRNRSAFAFAMLFSHLLPRERVAALLESYIADKEARLAGLTAHTADAHTPGESFVNGLGRTVYAAMLDYLRQHRSGMTACAEAAE
jgi:hypothetical protein